MADLVLRFEWCYDTRNYQALEDMLTEDAVMDHVWGYREGRSAVLTMLREWEYANAGLRHQGINLVVWGEPDGTAGAMSFLYGVTMRGPITGGSAGEGPVFERPAGHGLVTDRFRRGSDGIWRMTRRTIDQMYLDAEFVPDAAVREWFALSAEQRQAYPDKPAGWLPDAA
ncbi:nuclear transport factor 2 family protein [Actinoplanes oblitus]|uniref:Nuclear transport factor 2 family protein n=1 Tax=Actinoplanes oblitus TaxID=3040509 RepID=A0ABY8W704_9ACTN|nr:nuclear transport factor 2 family protein [Actinoplanes oblitus]WIM92808.1 nuclear transport factor 2 family protein [Actinoplanes oblitus]